MVFRATALLAFLALGCDGLALRPTMSLGAQESFDTRRGFASKVALGGLALGARPLASRASVIDPKASRVLVAGASGQTGSRVLSQLVKEYPGVVAVAGVRNPKKLPAGTASVRLDVTDQTTMAAALEGCDAVICAVGFVPGNPLKMGSAAHAVDNVGTIALIDAAKAAGIKKFTLVSSILTDGRSWGQEDSVGFKITNAFGGVLDEKIVAEKYLRQSGLDYTIVRPGGLKATPPSGTLVVSGENTLNSGEVSRDLVASVCIQSLFSANSANRVVELYEDDEGTAPVLTKENWF